jgi:serine/threonine-protein kinase
MSPEQVRDAKNVDIRTDIFSLGCILYELVCGRRAFVGKDTLEVFNKVAGGDFEAPSLMGRNLPERICKAIEGALTVDPSRRIPNCAVLGAVLNGSKSWELPEVDVAPLTLDWALESRHGQATADPQERPTDPGPSSRDTMRPVREAKPPRRWIPVLSLLLILGVAGAGLAWTMRPEPPVEAEVLPEADSPGADGGTAPLAAVPKGPPPAPEVSPPPAAAEAPPDQPSPEPLAEAPAVPELPEEPTSLSGLFKSLEGFDSTLSGGLDSLEDGLEEGELGLERAAERLETDDAPPDPASAPAGPTPGTLREKKSLAKQLRTLGRSWSAQGFSMADIKTQGTMSQGQSNQVGLYTDMDARYLVIGACGPNCGDLDLFIFDDRGRLVTQSTGQEDLPAVVFKAGDWTEYTIKVTMSHCASEACTYQVNVLYGEGM